MLTLDEAIKIVHDRSSALVDGLGGERHDGPGDPARVRSAAGVDAVRPLLVGCDLDVEAAITRSLVVSENALTNTVQFAMVVVATPEQWSQMVYTLHGALVQQLLLGYLLGEAAGREAGCPERG